MTQELNAPAQALWQSFKQGYDTEAKWSPDGYAVVNHSYKLKDTSVSTAKTLWNAFSGKIPSTSEIVAPLVGAGISAVTSPRAGFLGILAVARLGVEADALNEQAAVVSALSLSTHLGRATRRSVNHAKAYPAHTLSWIVASFMLGRISSLQGLTFAAGFGAGYLCDGLLLKVFQPDEKSDKAIKWVQPKAKWLNDTFGELRKPLNKNPLFPVVFAALATGLYLTSRLAPNISVWPLALPAAIVAGAVEGHYMSNPL